MSSDVSRIRKDALAIFQAGVNAAEPFQAVTNCLLPVFGVDGTESRWTKIHIIAFGKAACAMAKAALEIIPASLLADKAIVVTNYENATAMDGIEVIASSHPLPDENGVDAAKKIVQRLSRTKEHELVLVLVSGGGSSLLPYPVSSCSLEEKIVTTDLLLSSGASINQINCVRKHLSYIKGGGLVKLAAPAELIALILSDVTGNDLSTVASGTTVPDDTSFADAIAVLQSRNVWSKTPANVRKHLLNGNKGIVPETLKPGDKLFTRTQNILIGSNAMSLNAAMKTAEKLGYHVRLYDAELTGEAKYQAEKWVVFIKNLDEAQMQLPIAFLAGGETTVTLTGNGKGGRNQEMGLAFALAAKKHGLKGKWVFLSGGTDGRDGPTDAAGGLVDQDSLQRMMAAGFDPESLLSNNDSYTALKTSADLLVTGATGTNVADLQVLLIHQFY
jgi:hydroxypyruvate reductase